MQLGLYFRGSRKAIFTFKIIHPQLFGKKSLIEQAGITADNSYVPVYLSTKKIEIS
jgi:hypothetical protein